MIRFRDLQGPVSDEKLQLASVFERVLQTDSEPVIQRLPYGAAGFESRMRLGKGYIDDGRPDHPLDRWSVLAAWLQRSNEAVPQTVEHVVSQAAARRSEARPR